MLQMSAEPKLDSCGRVVGAVCVGEDILARRRVEEKQRLMLQLERENQLKVRADKPLALRATGQPRLARAAAGG
jgi:hypothetical protein